MHGWQHALTLAQCIKQLFTDCHLHQRTIDSHVQTINSKNWLHFKRKVPNLFDCNKFQEITGMTFSPWSLCRLHVKYRKKSDT